MKAKILYAAVAVSGLMAVGGTVLADVDAHDGYRRAFSGDSGVVQAQAESSASMGKAAYGTAAATPFVGPKGGVIVLTTNGLAGWPDTSSDSAMGKAAFGSGSSDSEAGHIAYHRAFYAD